MDREVEIHVWTTIIVKLLFLGMKIGMSCTALIFKIFRVCA